MISNLLSLSLILSQPAQGEPQHSLTFSVFTNRKLNDDQGLISQLPKPILNYRYNPPSISVSLLLAALYNRVDLNIPLGHQTEVYFGADGLITIAGDSPRVDGEDLEDYEFKGHRLSTFAGVLYKWEPGILKLRLKAEYHSDFLFNYDGPSSGLFTMPQNFTDHGFALMVEGTRPPPSELMDFGIRPLVYLSYRFRDNNRAWGANSNLKEIDSYFMAATRIQAALPLSDDFVLTSRIHGSYVSDADRLNAIKEGSIRIGHLGILMSDIRVDRSVGGSLGLRWYCFSTRKFALSPFAHALTYREIRVDRTKVDTGFGPGLTVSGQWGERFLWSLLYGSMFGNRNDVQGLHEIQLNLSYRFIP